MICAQNHQGYSESSRHQARKGSVKCDGAGSGILSPSAHPVLSRVVNGVGGLESSGADPRWVSLES